MRVRECARALLCVCRYIIYILPLLLNCFGDPVPSVSVRAYIWTCLWVIDVFVCVCVMRAALVTRCPR